MTRPLRVVLEAAARLIARERPELRRAWLGYFIAALEDRCGPDVVDELAHQAQLHRRRLDVVDELGSRRLRRTEGGQR